MRAMVWQGGQRGSAVVALGMSVLGGDEAEESVAWVAGRALWRDPAWLRSRSSPPTELVPPTKESPALTIIAPRAPHPHPHFLAQPVPGVSRAFLTLHVSRYFDRNVERAILAAGKDVPRPPRPGLPKEQHGAERKTRSRRLEMMSVEGS